MKTITHRSSWLLSTWSLMLCLISLFYTQRADAQACKFQQGQNGGVNAAVISPIDFARGNVNGSKAHYVEGNSIPYRIEFTTLSANTQYRALISFDVKKQTKHAMDFITGFQNLKYSTTDPAEQVNPILGTGLEGVSGIVVNTFPIPNPTFSTDASYNTTATNAFTLLKTPAYFNPEVTVPASPLSAAVRDKGNIAIWNATINSIQYVNTINTNLSDVHATFEVIFTKANNANPVVMAWGGHISSTQTWGEGLSAHDIPGSPYHMYVETVETSDGVNTICNGNMDCQLSSNAVSILPTCSISGPTIACPETNLLTYTATLDAATFGAVNYTWLLTNGTPSAGAQLTGTLSGSTTAASMIREVTPLVTDFIAGGKFRLQLTVERDGNSAVCYLNSSSAPGDSVLINDVATTASASPTSFSLNTTSISNLSATTLLNGVTDNGAFTYAWTVTSPGGLNGGSLTGVSTRTPQFTAVNPGTYKFRVTATQTAAPNCVDIDSVTVVVTAKQACPTVPRNPLCADATSATYTASTPPDTDVTYIWLVNNGTVITSANGLQSVTVDPGTISFTLSLVLDYANPSILNDTCSYPVTVNPLPAVNTGNYGPYCIDATPVTLSGTPSGGTWSGPGVTGTTFNVQTAGVGTHQIIYNYTDANGCSAADTTNITVNQLPVVNTGSYGPYCIDATPVTLSGTPSGGTWSGPGVSGTTFNVQTAGVGTHQIIYNYTDANGCSAADTISIVVNALPSVNTGTYGPYCIDATPVTLSGTPGGGTWSGPGVTGTTFNVQTAGVGTHQIIYNYTNANGCSAADTTSIVVNPLPVVNTGSYGPYCIDATPVTLSGTPSGGTWSGPGVSGTTLNVQTAGVGTHQIIYNYTNANGCSAADTTNITVNPLPVVNTGAYGPYCIDASPVTLSGTPSGGTWSGPGVSGTTFNVQTAGVGTHQIIYNYTDANGCSAADTTSIIINPLPVVNTGSYDPVCDNETTVSLTGTPSGGTWSGPGVSGTTFNVQTAGIGTHQLIYNYSDANGCSAADTTEIVVEDCGDDDFCTYTQGYFGSKNGKACDGDSLYQNPVSLIRSLLLPGNIILGAGVRTITITVNDSVRVNMVMPGGSTPRALTHTGNISMSQLGAYNYLNRQGRLNNVFLSQTLALSLNLRINPTLMHFILDSGYLVTQKLANCGDTTTTLSCEMDSSAIQSWPMNSSVVGYLEENGGATVENLLMLANKLLGQVLMPGASGAGATMVPSYSAVSGMVSTINEAFDECRVFLLYNPTKMECPEMGITQRYVDVPVEPTRSTIRVNAFPNPYGKLVQFSMTANIDGQAELSLFDLSGRQLAQLYQGIWKAGDWRLINYAIKPGQAIPMIYRFRVGKEVVTGKLMPGN